eukprot:CAMPEP_0168557276 /NCGR_PEP_ID=MMETSP0413-20121227/9339_1 /TAXON_ID=136452 /ORGANISM="Filamoeba nolandi, Strain NC-AS-23-1" /LENGTH=493 /DNA_ID=CAMNT_0008588297 /DNA_START=29 /DNA_END=1510 /DNA_ORIENTATION=-
MLLTIATLISAALLGALLYIILIPYTFQVRKIPGPKPESAWMGNFWTIRKEEPGDPQLKWANEHSDSGIVRYYFWFNRPSVMVIGPNEVKHVLVTKVSNYDSKPFGGTFFFDRFFKEGLLMLEGDLHRRHRKMIQPAFNYSSLKEMLPIFASKATAWVKLHQGKLQRDASKNVLEFDTEMSNLTLDVIGLAGFGVDFDAISDEQGFMAGLYKTLMGEMTLSFKLLIPFWYNIPLKHNRMIAEKAIQLEKVIYDLIKTKRQSKLENSSRHNQDLMDLLLDARDDETNTKMTDAQLNNHVMTFMVAGHETTSVALSWMFYSLAQRPEIAETLYEEIKNIDFTSITVDQLEQLSYLNNVVRETLRLYPPAALTSRLAKEDDEIDGYKIPKGTRIMVVPAVNHRLEKYWGPTANDFDPSRWDTQQVKELPQYAFLPFLLGPRQCIGMKFALLEMKILSAIILQAFTFKVPPGTQVRKKLFITMKPHPRLPLFIYPRK